MNDSAWFAKSREFRNINIIATQSLSSLYEKTYNNSSVDSLMNNCSTKIIMQLEDPMTTKWLQLAFNNTTINPSALDVGECLLFTYSLSTHKLQILHDGTQAAYKALNELLQILEAKAAQDMPPAPSQPQEPAGEAPHPSGLPRTLVRVIMAELDRPTTPDEAPASAPYTSRRLPCRDVQGDSENALALLNAAMKKDADQNKTIKNNKEIIAEKEAKLRAVYCEPYDTEPTPEEIAVVLENTERATALLENLINGRDKPETARNEAQAKALRARIIRESPGPGVPGRAFYEAEGPDEARAKAREEQKLAYIRNAQNEAQNDNRPRPWIPSPSALAALEEAKAKAVARIEARKAREDAARAALRKARRTRPGRPQQAQRTAQARQSTRPEPKE